MIRYYAYYSCGGYKDMYLGSDEDLVENSYFVPLLAIWQRRNNPEDAERIAKAGKLQHIRIISKAEPHGFPEECNLLFSHGGYKAICRTLTNGAVCFCIRDISSDAKDEEQRDIPFNVMFVADGNDSIKKLDSFAVSYITGSSRIETIIQDLISYDPYINGIRFNLSGINGLISNSAGLNNPIVHAPGKVIFIKIDSREYIETALSEQNIDIKKVAACIDNNGIFYGKIPYISESHNGIRTNDIDARQNDMAEIFGNVKVNQNTSDDRSEDEASKIYEDIAFIKKQIKELSNDLEQRYMLIMESMNKEHTISDKHSVRDIITGITNKQTVILFIVAITAFILGALIF